MLYVLNFWKYVLHICHDFKNNLNKAHDNIISTFLFDPSFFKSNVVLRSFTNNFPHDGVLKKMLKFFRR